jgi:NAD(P)-dependent dehydrogenase (short-subunit alcohol dehydrogenase family)
VEFAEAGLPIRVNSVHPGGVETPLFERGLRQQAAATGIDIAVLREQAMLAAPMRRVAQPIEIGRAVAFLASDDASYMTGSELVVDGGWSAR